MIAKKGNTIYIFLMLSPINPPKTYDFLMIFLLGTIWSSSFGVMKFLLNDFSPLGISMFRTGIGGLLLLPFIVGKTLPRSIKDWLLIAGIALFGNALPFTLIPLGETRIDSGLAGMLMSMGPIFALLVNHFTTPDDKITKRKFAGMCLGLTGALFIFGKSVFDGEIDQIPYILFVVLASIFYVTSGVLIRHLGHINTLVTTCLCLLVATLFSAPFSFIAGDPFGSEISNIRLFAMFYLGAIPTALAFFLRLVLVKRAGYTFFSYVGYIIPVFSLCFGIIFFDETLTLDKTFALIFILAGLGLFRK